MKLRRDDAPVVVSLSLLHFLIIASFTLARIARDGLFLSELPVQYLPYVYLGLAAWTVLAVWGFEKLTGNRPSHNTLSIALCVTGVSLFLFAILFTRAPDKAAVFFYLWSGAYGLILVSQFWILANERINPRDAKRFFGIIGASGILGGLAGAATATLLGDRIAPNWILVVVAFLHLAGAAIANRSGVRERERAPVLPGLSKAKTGGMRRAFAEPYVRLLAFLFLAGGITSGVLDYEFKYFLQIRSGMDAGRITAFLGLFYGAQNVLALIAQLGVAGLVLSRFGPRAAATALPIGVLAGSAITLISPVFAAVALTRLYDSASRVSISRSAWEFLYYPLGDVLKRHAKRLNEVIVPRLSDAGAGVLILLVNTFAGGGIAEITIVVLLLALGWIGLEFVVNRAYRAQASRPLHRAVPVRPHGSQRIDALEPSTDWGQHLESEDEGRVLYAIEVLQTADPAAIEARKDRLLYHPSEAVRARTLSLLIANGANVDGFEWGAYPSREVATGEATAEIDLTESTADRVAVAAAAGRSYGSDIPRRRLPELIDVVERDVRVTAFRSAALGGDRRHVPMLLQKLEDPYDRKDAREALVLYGGRIVGSLGDHLADPSLSLTIRVEITKVLAEIGTQDAAYSLFRAGHLGVDRLVVNQVLRALNRVRLKDPSISLPWDVVRDRLDQEIFRYCRRIVQGRAVRPVKDAQVCELLGRVLRERREQSLARIFRRLGLVYATGDTLLAYEGYLSGNARLRAQSLEYLDTILTARHRALLLPVLEETSEERKVELAGEVLHRGSPSFYGTIMEMIESRETWLRAVGLFTIGSMKLEIHADQVYGCLRSPDPIVRDTAEWAKGRLAEAR